MKKTILSLAFVLAFAIPKTGCAFPSGVDGDGEPQEEAGAVHHSESPVVAPQAAVPQLENNEGGAMYSEKQQLLFSQWEEGKIGYRAWSALGGDLLTLSKALYDAIVEVMNIHPGKKVEICLLKVNNFKLSIDGYNQQKIYIF